MWFSMCWLIALSTVYGAYWTNNEHQKPSHRNKDRNNEACMNLVIALAAVEALKIAAMVYVIRRTVAARKREQFTRAVMWR